MFEARLNGPPQSLVARFLVFIAALWFIFNLAPIYEVLETLRIVGKENSAPIKVRIFDIVLNAGWHFLNFFIFAVVIQLLSDIRWYLSRQHLSIAAE
jgi:hypothetical protein